MGLTSFPQKSLVLPVEDRLWRPAGSLASQWFCWATLLLIDVSGLRQERSHMVLCQGSQPCFQVQGFHQVYQPRSISSFGGTDALFEAGAIDVSGGYAQRRDE